MIWVNEVFWGEMKAELNNSLTEIEIAMIFLNIIGGYHKDGILVIRLNVRRRIYKNLSSLIS